MRRSKQLARKIIYRVFFLTIALLLLVIGFNWCKNTYYLNKFDLNKKEYAKIQKVLSTQKQIKGYDAHIEGQIFQKGEELNFVYTYTMRDDIIFTQAMDTDMDVSDLGQYLIKIDDIMASSNKDIFRTNLALVEEDKLIVDIREGRLESGTYNIENYIYFNDENRIVSQNTHLIWVGNNDVTEYYQSSRTNIVY